MGQVTDAPRGEHIQLTRGQFSGECWNHLRFRRTNRRNHSFLNFAPTARPQLSQKTMPASGQTGIDASRVKPRSGACGALDASIPVWRPAWQGFQGRVRPRGGLTLHPKQQSIGDPSVYLRWIEFPFPNTLFPRRSAANSGARPSVTVRAQFPSGRPRNKSGGRVSFFF
jgi:hypothetical protein